MGESRLRELIRSYQERGIATDFCEHMLGRLLRYDRLRNADLLHTLRAYFRCNGNVLETADRLFLHRNSVLYRLQRIEELLQVDMKDYQVRLALGLALEMAELLQEHPAE